MILHPGTLYYVPNIVLNFHLDWFSTFWCFISTQSSTSVVRRVDRCVWIADATASVCAERRRSTSVLGEEIKMSWQCDNLIFISHQNQQYHSASVTSHMKSLMSHRLHFTASDIPLQSFSDFRKVPRSPIIRSVRLLAAHAARHGRQCTLPAEHTVRSAPSFISTPPICSERNYVTSKPETENRFLAFPKTENKTEKPVLQKEPGFRNPTLRLTLNSEFVFADLQ